MQNFLHLQLASVPLCISQILILYRVCLHIKVALIYTSRDWVWIINHYSQPCQSLTRISTDRQISSPIIFLIPICCCFFISLNVYLEVKCHQCECWNLIYARLTVFVTSCLDTANLILFGHHFELQLQQIPENA